MQKQAVGVKRKAEPEDTQVSGSDSKQKKISDMISPQPKRSVLMPHCVGLVTQCGRPLQIFEDQPMKEILGLGRKGANEEEYKAINGPNVRAAIADECAALREKIYKELANRIVNLTADMATCQHRCFLGKQDLLANEN